MEFGGAVLVSNEKIKEACDNYKPLHNESLDLIRGLILKAREGYDTLSWWQKNVSCNDMYYKNEHIYLKSLTDEVNVWSIAISFLDIGWLTQEEYNFYNSLQGTVYDQLTTLIKAGEPVYLNVEQAEFVNKYLRMGEVVDENEG